MVLLNKIKEMKQKGASDEEIVRSLRQEGVPPKEINNALSQSKIKAAVNGEVYSETQNMQRSLSPQAQEGAYPLPQEPQEQTVYPQEQIEYPQEQAQEVQEQQEQAPALSMEEQAFPQAYPQYEQYEPMPQSISGDIVSEIAEQIAEEKISQIKKQIERLQDIESNIGLRVVDMEKRLERIESIIDNLQNSFIKKVGIYGQSIEDIKTEMQGMQETFSKMVSPLVDNIKKTEINSGKTRRRI